MSQIIIGLDIGSYSVKAVAVDRRQRDLLLGVQQERVVAATAPLPPAPDMPAPSLQGAAGDAQAPGAQGGDSATADETWERPAHEAGEALAEGATPADAALAAGDAQDDVEAAPEADALAPWASAAQRAMILLAQSSESIISALPFDQAMTIQLKDLPPGDKGKLRSVMKNMLPDRLPMAPHLVVYDFRVNSVAGQVGPQEGVIAFARREDMGAFLARAGEAGVDPMVVGVPEMMLEFAARAVLGESLAQRSIAVLDLGHEHTRVLVLRQGQPVLARAIKRGGANLTQAIAQKFQIPEDQAEQIKHQHGALLEAGESQDAGMVAMSEALHGALAPLVRDLRRTFQSLAARDNVTIEQIYLCGGTSKLKHITRHLEAAMGVPVTPLALAPNPNPLLPSLEPQHALAWSMASMPGQDLQSQRRLNLRQGELAWRGRSSFVRAQLWRYGAAGAILLMLMASALVMKRRDLNAQRDAMRAAVSVETRKVFGAPLLTRKAVEQRLLDDGAAEGDLTPRSSAYSVLYELVSRISETHKLRLNRIEVDMTRNLVQVYGETSSPQTVDLLVTELEQLECLRSIKKDKLQVKSDTETNFELQINASGCT